MLVLRLSFVFGLSIALLLTIFNTQVAEAQPNPPQIDCASTNNSVTDIVWINDSAQDCNGIGAFENYVIYRSETPEGPFTEIAVTSSNPPYNDPTGSTIFYYYMTIRCGGQESAPSDTVINRRPEPPIVLNTTVLPDGSVQVAFLPSPNSEVSGYILNRYENGSAGGGTTLDDVTDFVEINDTLYMTDPGIDATIGSIGYSLSSFSCSQSPNPGGLSPIHFTIFVEAEVDDCQDLVNVSWTPYEAWNRVEDGVLVDSVKTYTIYTETDTTVIDAPITTLTYPIAPSIADKCFRIVANNTTNLASESNEICVSRIASNPPTDICFDFLTIDTLENQVELEWEIDLSSEISSIVIFRGTSPENLQPVNTILEDDLFFDNIVDAVDINAGPYFYQIVHIDDCNRRVESNIGNTIFLRGRNRLDASNLLEWNEFSMGEGTTLSGYTLYRSEDTPIKNFTPIETMDGNVVSFVDVVENQEAAYCYYLEAQYSVACNDGTISTETSQSNEVCIFQSPRMFVPNAFAPNGVNKIFKPIIRNPNPNDYQMVVFSRWGEHVFTTSDPEDGWDGFYQGKLAPQGVYAYYIRMQTELGFLLERKGTVVLVR